MVKNCVLEINNFILERFLIKFKKVKSMAFNPNRINLFIDAVCAPSKEFLESKSNLFTFSYTKEAEDAYTLCFVGVNNEETLEAIKEALIKY